MEMPQFWKIDTTQWINPGHIAHIEDDPTRTPPRLVITMAGDMPALRGRGVEHYTMELYSPASESFSISRTMLNRTSVRSPRKPVQQTPVWWTGSRLGESQGFLRHKVSIYLSNNRVSIGLYTAMS